MKKIFQIILAVALLFLGYKLNLPWEKFPFEHFEYQIASIFPFSWKLISILSRLIIGFIFVCGFYLILKNERFSWLKYISIIAISIPFIINPVFPENWKNESPKSNRSMSFESANNLEEKKVLLAYFTDGCRFCKEAAIKLEIARKRDKNFPEVIVVSDNNNLESYFNENNLSYSLEIIPQQTLLQTARGSFPHFQLIENNQVIYDWNNMQFNYEVLDMLSDN